MTPVMEREQLLRMLSVQFGTRKPTCCEVNELLLNMLDQIVQAWSTHLTMTHGMSTVQVDEQIAHNEHMLNEWRLDTLEWVLNQYEKDAHTLH